jgi:hypothetical protein
MVRDLFSTVLLLLLSLILDIFQPVKLSLTSKLLLSVLFNLADYITPIAYL